jgi:F-type H+-transporting ATPase subunit gamma
MDRAAAATAYTQRITQLVADLTHAGLEVSHPLLEYHAATNNVILLVITANRGFCGGFNGNLLRAGSLRWKELQAVAPLCRLEVSGKRGISGFKFRGIEPDVTFSQFEDKPAFDEVEVIANRYLDDYATGKLDRLDVVYMKFHSVSRQTVEVETLLPLGALAETSPMTGPQHEEASIYEFIPSPESILQEVVPASFKVKLFKCFLDSAVSEQIARMVAMKAATENADDLIRRLSMQYNRARQSRITSELMDVIGGVEALS